MSNILLVANRYVRDIKNAEPAKGEAVRYADRSLCASGIRENPYRRPPDNSVRSFSTALQKGLQSALDIASDLAYPVCYSIKRKPRGSAAL